MQCECFIGCEQKTLIRNYRMYIAMPTTLLQTAKEAVGRSLAHTGDRDRAAESVARLKRKLASSSCTYGPKTREEVRD